MSNDSKTPDPWYKWLLERRHGGSAEHLPKVQEDVARYRDRVLDAARLAPGMTLIDVGTGDGLIGLSALERVGPGLRVIMTDISGSLLRHVEEIAEKRGVRAQCELLQCSADRLQGIANHTADVVATRAVLAYVQDKPAAFREFHRVLKPGGRICLAEPILQDDAFETCALTQLVQTQPAHPNIEFLRLLQRCRAAQYPSTQEAMARNPQTNYSERDLARMAREAGFQHIHLELHIDHRPNLISNWDLFLDVAPHPLVASLREILSTKFSGEERARFESVMRPVVESGRSMSSEFIAYLNATKNP